MVLSCHRCVINTDVEKWTTFKYRLETLTTGCHKVRVHVGIQTIEKHILDTDAGKQWS